MTISDYLIGNNIGNNLHMTQLDKNKYFLRKPIWMMWFDLPNNYIKIKVILKCIIYTVTMVSDSGGLTIKSLPFQLVVSGIKRN